MDNHRNRSGRYLSQPSGYRAFIPSPLPPNPEIVITEELRKALIEAEQLLPQLNGISFSVPNPDLFNTMAIRKEALLSSQIEGTQATMTDILTYEAWEEVDNFDDVQEVINYIKAQKESIDKLYKLPLGIRLIKEAHYILLQGERGKDKQPGEFRKSQNWIGGSSPSKALFVPPPWPEAHEAMGDLEKFINMNHTLPHLVKCALIHYQFETIHPFLDGNGRIGRLMIELYLHYNHLLVKPLLYTSLYFKINRQDYFNSLSKVRETGDYEQWINFFVKGIIWSSKYAIDKIHAVVQLKEELKEKILNTEKASLQSIKLLDLLFRRPLITISMIKDELDLSFQGASGQVAIFLKLNILKELTGQKRGRRFVFAPYLEIIED